MIFLLEINQCISFQFGLYHQDFCLLLYCYNLCIHQISKTLLKLQLFHKDLITTLNLYGTEGRQTYKLLHFLQRYLIVVHFLKTTHQKQMIQNQVQELFGLVQLRNDFISQVFHRQVNANLSLQQLSQTLFMMQLGKILILKPSKIHIEDYYVFILKNLTISKYH